MSRRFPFGLTAVVVICEVILVGLGVWQLQRMEWKQALLDRRAALLDAAPAPLIPTLAAGGDLDMTRVETVCPGLSQAPFEELYGVAQGQMVSRLVSACPLAGAPYEAILVDRGYVLDSISARPAEFAGDTYPASVVGVLMAPVGSGRAATGSMVVDSLPNRAGKKRWMTRDLPGMAASLGVKNPAPYFLVAETSSNPDWKALTPGMPPVIIPNNHLGYAFTWFALAGVLAAIYAALLRKRLKA